MKSAIVYFEEGFLYREKGEFEKALESYTKAEHDSIEGKYPEASYNKGAIYMVMGEFEKAIKSYTKAEQDSICEKFPKASYNKGLSFYKLRDKDNALKSYNKAENDSFNRKYPQATYNKASIYYQIREYEKAIDCFTKAERDSIDSKFPDASLYKAITYVENGKKEKALESFTKAEDDSDGGKFPEASYNKAVLYNELGQKTDALKSYTKSEIDSINGKHPMASSNKGWIYLNLGQFSNAIICFNKAIFDSSNNNHPEAHLGRSVSYYRIQEFKLSFEDAFIAIEQDDRFQGAIENIVERHCNLKSKSIYQSRLKYLALEVALSLKKRSVFNFEKQEDSYLFIQEKLTNDINSFIYLCLQEPIQFPTAISRLKRLRVGYLVAYLCELYHYSFYIIDSLIDSDYKLSDMDKYFYLASAYFVGEPVSELKYYCQGAFEKDIQMHGFGLLYKKLAEKVNKAIEEDNRIDPYLLDISSDGFRLSKDLSNEFKNEHPWIVKAIEGIASGKSTYQLPLTKNELKGLLHRFFVSFDEKYSSTKFNENRNWLNFKSNLKLYENYKAQVENIKMSIDDKIPPGLILVELFSAYDLTDNEIDRHNIAVLQATVIVYSKSKKNIGNGISVETSKLVLGFFSEIGAKDIFGGIIAFGLGASLGLSIAVNLIVSKTINLIIDKITLDKKIDELKSEIIQKQAK